MELQSEEDTRMNMPTHHLTNPHIRSYERYDE